jgi:hypothetical protein
MVFPDLFEEQECCAFGIDGGMHGDKVCALGYTVDNIHNCVVAMGFRQFNYEVHTDNPNTTQTLEYTKDKYNVRIIK